MTKWKKIKKYFEQRKTKKLEDHFSKEYPGKRTWDLSRIFSVSGLLLLVFMIFTSFMSDTNTDTSSYSKGGFEEYEDSSNNEGTENSEQQKEACAVKGISCGNKTTYSNKPKKKRGQKEKLNFKATQVIVRKDLKKALRLPTGSSFIGKLLTRVDTRMGSGKLIRVLLPNGAAFNGKKLLPNKTILLGQAAYPSRGKRVFINFSLAVMPNGKEMNLQASALDSKDFSPGVIGRYHSAFKNRAVATAGLSFLAGFSETMQEREALGAGSGEFPSIPVVNKKATIKNSVLSGLSEFSKTEGALQLEELRSKGPFVTIKQGRPLIITLTQSLVGK